METKHEGFTPGPWRSDGLQVFGHSLLICEAEDHVDARYDNSAVMTANARLIAAAPELLAERDQLRAVNKELVAVLQHLVNNVTAYCDPGYDNRHYYRDEKKLIETANRARAALAKVK